MIYEFEIHRLQQFAGHSHRHAPEIRNKILLAQIRSDDGRGANESGIANRDIARKLKKEKREQRRDLGVASPLLIVSGKTNFN